MSDAQKVPSATVPQPPVALPCPSFTEILHEHNVPERQRHSRLKLLKKLQQKDYNDQHEKNAVVAIIANDGTMGSGIDAIDVPTLGNALRQIGDVDVLNLILHSPGGDGTCVEKMIALCRNQCKVFRVVIPNRAKSAATMIALGADEVLMGPTSEIGPIDAQVPVIVEGFSKYISAQSFIDAKALLVKEYYDAKKKKEDTKPFLQMMASLDIPHIVECERMMDFGRDAVKKLLLAHMLKGNPDAGRTHLIRGAGWSAGFEPGRRQGERMGSGSLDDQVGISLAQAKETAVVGDVLS